MLTELGARYGFEVDPIEPVNVRGERVSSSLVRQMARDRKGQPRLPPAGPAVRARREGRQGPRRRREADRSHFESAAPTEVWPADGVYVSRTYDLDPDRAWDSITNIGNRPTFGGNETSVETFLLEPLTGPPPEHIRVEFLWRVREERKFPGRGFEGADPARCCRGTKVFSAGRR